MKDTKIPRINPAERLLYALFGLMAGGLILLFPFCNMHSMPTILAENLHARFQIRFRPSFSMRSSHSQVGYL